MHHGPELFAAGMVALALALGVIARWLSPRVGLPYTVLMLLAGLVAGVAVPFVTATGHDGHLPMLTPDLILFGFLPALVFESAFALDVYAFRRDLGAIALLAVPAMVLSTVLTAGLVLGFAGPAWGWSLAAALVFGALISATDPVAVVAVLRELGAPKRLGVLIEGESLLNDGTAIVAFGVLLAMLTGADGHGSASVGGVLLDFARVVVGGVVVGLAIGALVTATLARTFNDPLIEISLTLIAAYAAMLIAEALLHVSGVMAVVTAGLVLGGPGQSRLSPEVRPFLHRFWEVLAHLANTLIFFLVGFLLAVELGDATLLDLGLILLTYAVVVAVRFGVIGAFLPVLARLPAPVSGREGVVMAWGGLRGAVSLALVLIVTQTEGVPEVLGHQMLRLAGGVVFLTVVFHGTTTGRVLDWMGLGEGPPSEQAAVLIVRKVVLEGVLAGLDTLAAAPSLRAVHWAAFRDRVKARIAALERTLEGLDRGVAEGERMASRWKVALRMEREAYWHAFGKGLLSGDGLRRLDRELDVHDDRLRVDPTWIPERRAPRIQHRSRVRRWLGLGPDARRLELGVHLDRAEAEMGPGVAQALRAQGDDELAAVYQGWGEEARARLERARVALPEVVRGIEERLAARAVLDLEREGLQHAAMDGALPESVAAGLAGEVEVRMKQLELEPLRAQLPETADLCRRLPLLEGLDEATLAAIAVATDEIALAEGEVLFEEGERGDALYVIARGALEVRSGDEVLTVLGAGDVVGEMALLSGQPRNATVRAKTGAVLGRVSRSRAAELLADPEVAERMWAHFGRHAADQHLRARVDDVVRRRWIRSHTPIRFEAGDALPAGAFLLLDGAVEGDGGRREAPAALADGPWRSVAAGRAFPLPA